MQAGLGPFYPCIHRSTATNRQSPADILHPQEYSHPWSNRRCRQCRHSRSNSARSSSDSVGCFRRPPKLERLMQKHYAVVPALRSVAGQEDKIVSPTQAVLFLPQTSRSAVKYCCVAIFSRSGIHWYAATGG